MTSDWLVLEVQAWDIFESLYCFLFASHAGVYS